MMNRRKKWQIVTVVWGICLAVAINMDAMSSRVTQQRRKLAQQSRRKGQVKPRMTQRRLLQVQRNQAAKKRLLKGNVASKVQEVPFRGGLIKPLSDEPKKPAIGSIKPTETRPTVESGVSMGLAPVGPFLYKLNEIEVAALFEEVSESTPISAPTLSPVESPVDPEKKEKGEVKPKPEEVAKAAKAVMEEVKKRQKLARYFIISSDGKQIFLAQKIRTTRGSKEEPYLTDIGFGRVTKEEEDRFLKSLRDIVTVQDVYNASYDEDNALFVVVKDNSSTVQTALKDNLAFIDEKEAQKNVSAAEANLSKSPSDSKAQAKLFFAKKQLEIAKKPQFAARDFKAVDIADLLKRGEKIVFEAIPVSYGTIHIVRQSWDEFKKNTQEKKLFGEPIAPSKVEEDPILKMNDTVLKQLADYLYDEVRGNFLEAVVTKAPLASGETWHGKYPDAIYFYKNNDPYYEFTNYWRAPILEGGRTWATSEVYFQAQKFAHLGMDNGSLYDYISRFNTSREAYTFAGQFRSDVNPSFSDNHSSTNDLYAITAMKKVLIAKFTQHRGLLKLLLDTGDKVLVEDTQKIESGSGTHADDRWGNGSTDTGRNYLGRLLMWIRDSSRAHLKSSGILK